MTASYLPNYASTPSRPVLPSITLVVERIWTDAAEGDLAVSLGLTLYRTLVGFFIASAGATIAIASPRAHGARKSAAATAKKAAPGQ